MQKRQFKAESKKLMDLMINSIYTHKEIFLREIISNASDAIDKLAYRALTDDSITLNRDDFKIKISIDKDERLITVSDNGIGMTDQELEENLGIIARSGSGEFKANIKESQGETDIIGQFGVGFYSAFMASDKVTVITKAYGSPKAYRWESMGADGYTITECEKDAIGTDVIMHIKPDAEEESYSEFLETYRLRSIVKKYSDYISWPIIMDIEKTVPKDTGEKDENGNPKMEYETVVSEETVNSMVPIWQRSKSEVSDEDCAAYYREKYFEGDPIKVIRISAEGTVSYKAMLFIPEKAPFDFYTRDFMPGLSLYSNGVMIMERCTDLVPDFFRFVKGVVDSPDLSLNISREVLQHNRQLKVIAANLEKKIKAELKKLMDDSREVYEKFYESFGLQLKYGIVSEFGAKKDLLKDLIMFHSCKEKKLISLEEYANKMPEDGKYIYYACAENPEKALALPQTEQVLENGFDILCFSHDVDEFTVKSLGQFGEKEFRNISSGDLGLEGQDEKEKAEKKQAQYAELLVFVKEHLGDKVFDVRLSRKLKTHPVCLSTEGEISLEMERYFASLPDGNMGTVKAQRVLELNGDHRVIEALNEAYVTDKDKAGKLADILLDQALLISGLSIDDPLSYTERICSLF